MAAQTCRALLAPSFLFSCQTLAYENHVGGTHAKRVTGELGSRYDSHFCYSSDCANGNSDGNGGYGGGNDGFDNRWSENVHEGENDGLVP